MAQGFIFDAPCPADAQAVVPRRRCQCARFAIETKPMANPCGIAQRRAIHCIVECKQPFLVQIELFGAFMIDIPTYTNLILKKQSKIHFRPVILLIISFVTIQMVSQRRFITSSSELNTSFLNPIERICFQICSMGFISGVYGDIERSCIFSGQRNAFDLCHAAPSHTNRIISSGYCSESFSRNILVHSVSQFGIVKKKLSPFRGSTAPNA